MLRYRVVALEAEIAEEVRRTLKAPVYGHPAHVELARGLGPCRLCLRPFRKGEEDRVLFTYNPFRAEAELPCPGPVFVHKEPCSRYEDPGFPPGLAGLPLTVEGYDRGGAGVLRLRLNGDPATAVAEVLADSRVAYAHLRNTEAGCFVARVERDDP